MPKHDFRADKGRRSFFLSFFSYSSFPSSCRSLILVLADSSFLFLFFFLFDLISLSVYPPIYAKLPPHRWKIFIGIIFLSMLCPPFWSLRHGLFTEQSTTAAATVIRCETEFQDPWRSIKPLSWEDPFPWTSLWTCQISHSGWAHRSIFFSFS